MPAHRLPREFHAKPKNNLVPIDIARLRQQPPENYLLDDGDLLGIYIEGVFSESEEPPQVHIPDDGDLPPAIGYPIPVRDDGTLPLPLIEPLNVRGLTLAQVESLVRRAYTVDRKILAPGKDRIIVTLMRPRTYRVVVMRQDGGIGDGETEQSSRGVVVVLPAYKNDVLNALAESGGLPGVDAKNEVIILRSKIADMRRRDAFIQQFYSHSPPECLCYPPLPDDPASVRIPLRLPPGQTPRFRPQDVILNDGDIVYIESREREVFYTGGLLGGGEHQLPRDRDLDVLTALSLAGGTIGGGGQGGAAGGGGAGGLRGFGGVPPGRVYILRTTPCGDQLTIAVDLNRAIADPQARPLIEAGDILVLRHKPKEELVNFGIGTFFTYGIRQLFNNRN